MINRRKKNRNKEKPKTREIEEKRIKGKNQRKEKSKKREVKEKKNRRKEKSTRISKYETGITTQIGQE